MPVVDTPGQSSAESVDLSQSEQNELLNTIERSFEDTRTLDTRVILEKLSTYESEILDAAAIAKGQFDKDFGGLTPASGQFGVDSLFSGYFGWNSWDNLGEVQAGQTVDWLDGDTPDNLNSGDGGQEDPLTIGDAASHIILGVGSYAPSPKISRLRFRLNDSPRTAITTEEAFRNTDMRLKWLRTPLVLDAEDDVYSELYAGHSGQAAPYLFGLSFVEEKEYRKVDPSDMVGTDQSNILVGQP